MNTMDENQAELKILRTKLNSNYPSESKKAARSVISMMRGGEDVSSLFSDMLRCVRTDDMELKKLVYLYLVTYSSREPEQAIMAVNTFVKDSESGNPLVRALAVRTMCRIKLESVAEHMISPLKRCLQDVDPYVRKTAALGAAKLYDVIPESVESSGIFDDLKKLLLDENPLVVTNATTAIFEISSHRQQPIIPLTAETMIPILGALSSSNEWCQTMLLDTVSRYVPNSTEDAQFLIDRLIPLLKNNNPSVVIGAFKCIFIFMSNDSRKPAEIFSQIIPPFISLVSSNEHEIQFVALRTLSLFVQKYPRSLSRQIREFFCKYNDPSYIKMEKLDIIVTLCSEKTAELVLNELHEYCNEVDVAYVKKSIRCVGQIAIKIEAAAPKCVDILVSLVDGRADYATEEAVVVVSDILRKFPGRFESVIAPVCSNFEQIKDPHAKAAAVWILGEHCNIIKDVDVLIDPYLDTFHDEQFEVQLQILTALVKLYLFKPEETKDQLQFMLNEATKSNVMPDVRNRAFFYWRILSANDNITQNIVRFNKVTTAHSGVKFDEKILNVLMHNMGSVSGVLHIVPDDFIVSKKHEIRDDYDLVEQSRNWRPVNIVKGGGSVEIAVDFDPTTFYVRLTNRGSVELSQFAIALNKNPVGLSFASIPMFQPSLSPNSSFEVEIPIMFNPANVDSLNTNTLDIAVKTNVETVFGNVVLPAVSATMVDGRVDQSSFSQTWRKIPNEENIKVEGCFLANDSVLRDRNVFIVGKSTNQTYLSLRLQPGIMFLVEIIEENNNMNISFKASDNKLNNYFKMSAKELFSA